MLFILQQISLKGKVFFNTIPGLLSKRKTDLRKSNNSENIWVTDSIQFENLSKFVETEISTLVAQSDFGKKFVLVTVTRFEEDLSRQDFINAPVDFFFYNEETLQVISFCESKNYFSDPI